jgi:hypothetical protein
MLKHQPCLVHFNGSAHEYEPVVWQLKPDIQAFLFADSIKGYQPQL